VFCLLGYNPFIDAYLAWENPANQTHFIVENMDNAKEVLIGYLRQLHIYMEGNVDATDQDLISMGFPPRKKAKPHPSPIEEQGPEFVVRPSTDNRLIIHYYSAGEQHKRAKPGGQRGVEIHWQISDVPIINKEDLRNFVFDTCTPHTLQFKGEQAGLTVYIALRWENTTGKPGAWSSDIVETKVPY
jgi:hypothetical protein